jgi:hypothetical protein
MGGNEECAKGKMTFEDELERYGNLVYTGTGCSMMPLIRQGQDLVEIVRKDDGVRCSKYDVVLYKRGDRYILHRILKVTREGYVIAGDHNYTREYDITDRQILGVLTAVVRDGRRINVNDKPYRVYVHMWCDFYHVRAVILVFKAFARRGIRAAALKVGL